MKKYQPKRPGLLQVGKTYSMLNVSPAMDPGAARKAKEEARKTLQKEYLQRRLAEVGFHG